ncbi:MAG: transporter [Lacunisphaera sp.]|nr:transporter [Lacunisphaera sp.]MDB6165536.1 transporter [Lacunisphaera sp.]
MSPSAPAPSAPATNYRWVICALLFAATTINYVDRNSLGVLKTILEKELNWSEADYGWIQFAFTAAYAIFPTILGRFIDRFGVKTSLAAALVMWSAMSVALGLVHTVVAFASVRFLLGMAEAANFPASIKAIAMWFPQKERALATGLFNSGTNVGVMISFGTVWLAETFGWQWAFVSIGAIGFAWLVFWKWGFDRPEKSARVSPSELDYIRSGQGQQQESIRLPWTTLLRFRQIWPFLIAKFLTDPVWWFYLYWLPSYLSKERGRDPMKSALLIALIYTGASLGSIIGGWFSGFLINRGWKVGSARYGAMLLPAILMPLSIVAYMTTSFTLCVALISLATACHQAWSANVFTSSTDLFPAKVSGSVVGLGATTGGLGGMFMTLLAAMTIQWTGNQKLIFIWAGLMHPLSLLIYWLWLRNDFTPANVDAVMDVSHSNKPLIGGGAALAVIGVLGTGLIASNWQTCVNAAKLAGAAGAATAAAGVIIIGVALVYAGLPKKNTV